MPVTALAIAPTLASLRRAKPLLGTLVDIRVEADDLTQAQRAIDAAFAEVAAVHRLMSFHEAGSDVSRLNRARPGECVEVDWRTAEVLQCAAMLCAESQGAFDVEAAEVLVDLGILPSVAVAASLAATPASTAGSMVARGAHAIDLGGIAKGYAVDRAIDVLLECGVASAMVNAGGDLRHHGPVPVEILLRDPADPSRVALSITLGNMALASSATRGLAATDLPSALIDTRARRPLAPGAGVSIVAPSCMLADGLTKVVLVSADAGHPMLGRHAARVVLHRAADGAST